jgi:sugar phosphate isomerase/epimerase
VYKSFNARALGLDLSAGSTVALAAQAGFQGVDLLIRNLLEEGFDPAALRARMEDLGLRGGAWPLPVAWRGDEATFRNDLDQLPRYAEAASVLGLSRTGTWVMPETPEATEGDRARVRMETFDRHVERIGAIARVLSEHGTRLGLEVIGVASVRTGRGATLFDRLEGNDFVRLLEAVRAEVPDVGLLLDAFHLFAAGDRLGSIVSRWGIDRVVWVHLADLAATSRGDRQTLQDGDRGLPGEHGAIDVRSFLRELAALGYDGPVTVEPLAGCRSLLGLGPEAVALKVATALQAAWPQAAAGRPPRTSG